MEFQTEAGHAETVFDLEFCPSNKDLIASCSYDGTVRVWEANTMKLVQINDTLKNSPVIKEEKHIIYSLSWHPMESKIALVGNLGYLMIFDCLKNKLLASSIPGGKTPSFKVDWNQLDPSYLVMGSQSGKAFVLGLLDSQAKQVKVCSSVDLGSEVYGVNWNPAVREEYLAGCLNGSVYLCNMNEVRPLKVYRGHEKRVFNVVFNPYVPNIFASGSDDLTIRLWDSKSGDTVKILKGHTHNVRALAFSPELPWLLISGSWDSTIKLWDCRTGTPLHTLSEHTADVYGLAFHPKRPFTFVSSSRDTTLRFWQLDSLVATLRLQMLLDTRNTQVCETPQQAYQTKGQYMLTSK